MADGMNYAPTARVHKPVCERGEFPFAVAFMDHGHIFGMAANLAQAGATLRKVYEPDPRKAALIVAQHPEAEVVDTFDAILQDPEIRLVAAAAVPDRRGPIGVEVMRHGKDYFTDKTPFTTLDQLAGSTPSATASGCRTRQRSMRQNW
jgi:predicted dehydrogenase